MTSTVIDRAARLADAGQAAQAVELLQTAAAGGDSAALVELGFWHLAGGRIPRDLGAARRCFRRAATAGRSDAAMLEVSFTGNGTGDAPQWTAAVELLERLAVRHAAAAEQLRLLGAMRLGPDGVPDRTPVGEIIVPGAIVRYPAFLSSAECRHVAVVAADRLTPTMVADPRTGELVPHPVRTSDGAVLGPVQETLVIQAIDRRIAAAAGTDVRQGEALTVLRYTPGQQYKPHLDTLPGTRNQRIATVLVYLNDAFTGGETRFDHHGVTITPRAGDALWFSNVRSDGGVDQRSVHAGLPVLSGTKWLATRWIRQRPYDPWTGPEAPADG